MDHDSQHTPMTTLISPVAFLIFNRPETTRKVFEEIRRARPSKLFVVADGPRNDAEQEVCKETRAVIEGVDWECEVHKNYSDTNLGCRNRVSSGLTWVFEQTDRAIVLEDDCLPHPTFFRFCDELLERYKDDKAVMHISGDNFQAKNPDFHCVESYYFSNISHIWGWASWSRAWKYYDVDVKRWPEIKQSCLLHDVFDDEPTAARWEDKMQSYYDKKINSWDGQWSFACLINHGLCIMPRVNLISNIGFGRDSTHTRQDAATNELANLPTYPIDFPLVHPPEKKINAQAVDYLSDYIFGVHLYRRPISRMKRLAKQTFPSLYKRLKNALGR